MSDFSPTPERQRQILSLVARHGRLSVAEIVERFSISQATARRDLESLVTSLAAIPGLRDLAMTTNGLLLARHADANARDYSNKTALYYALINEHADIAALLKKSGAKD